MSLKEKSDHPSVHCRLLLLLLLLLYIVHRRLAENDHRVALVVVDERPNVGERLLDGPLRDDVLLRASVPLK